MAPQAKEMDRAEIAAGSARTRRWPALVVAFSLVAAGCGGGDEEVRRSIASFAVGDCLVSGDDGVEGVDCEEMHDSQVYARFEVDGDERPPEADLRTAADEGCVDRWQTGVGTNYFTDNQFDFQAVVPTPDEWDSGGRSVTCLLVLAGGGQVSGDRIVG